LGEKEKKKKSQNYQRYLPARVSSPAKATGHRQIFVFSCPFSFYFIFLLWGYHLIFAHPTWAENVIFF
jgi:hypothetical protein